MSADTDPASPLPLTVFSHVGERSVAKMLAVVASLNVETRLRYQVRDINGDGKDETFCNVFAADYTRGMCAEIPHWVDAEGRPSSGLLAATSSRPTQHRAGLRTTGYNTAGSVPMPSRRCATETWVSLRVSRG